MVNQAQWLYNFFMLNSTEHEISTANKLKYRQMKKFFALSISDAVFIMLIYVKMLKNCWHFDIYEHNNFVLSWVEHEK